MKKISILKLFFILLMVSTAFYFRNNLFDFYNNFGEKFSNTDWQKTIKNIEKSVLAPTPLNIGGKANSVVLVKSKIIAQTNIQRYDNGMLPPLFENEELNATALAKAQDMFAKQYFEHVSPSGIGPGELAKSHGYEYIVEGENLILGNFKDEQEVVQLWMDSPGHRANILNDRFTEIGVAIIKGVYQGQKVWIGVQEFGLPLSACPQADMDLKNQIEVNNATLGNMALELEAKKKEINNTNQKSPKYNELVNEYNSMVAQYNALNEKNKKIILEYNYQINALNQCVAGT